MATDLEPGQDLRRVAPPFPPIRMEYYRTGHPSQSDAIKDGPSAMVFRWTGGKLRNWGMTFGDSVDAGYSLTSVLDTLARYQEPTDRRSTRELLEMRLAGDWVIREGADQVAVLKQSARYSAKRILASGETGISRSGAGGVCCPRRV